MVDINEVAYGQQVVGVSISLPVPELVHAAARAAICAGSGDCSSTQHTVHGYRSQCPLPMRKARRNKQNGWTWSAYSHTGVKEKCHFGLPSPVYPVARLEHPPATSTLTTMVSPSTIPLDPRSRQLVMGRPFPPSLYALIRSWLPSAVITREVYNAERTNGSQRNPKVAAPFTGPSAVLKDLQTRGDRRGGCKAQFL